jgi:sirohydrochlorin ferrochelatase
MAHGTPLPAANAPLYQVAAQVADQTGIAHHRVGYLDCNQPEIPAALAELAEAGTTQIVALPYFLHLGRHVREDLPARVAQAQAALPQITICSAHHLDYDPLLVDALAERIAQIWPIRRHVGSGEPALRWPADRQIKEIA